MLLLAKARRLHRRRLVAQMPVSVETQAGALRRWKNHHDGTEGATRNLHDYGYVRGTLGLDGEQLDVFVGPDKDASHAYVVTQMRAPDFKERDEHKAMLSFRDIDEAKAAYLRHYSDPRFFGGIEAVPIAEFRRRARSERPFGRLVKKAENVAPDVFAAGARPGLARELVAPRDKRPPPFVAPDGRAYADPDFIAPWVTGEQRARALERSGLRALWGAGELLGHGGFATVFGAGPGAVVKVTQSRTDGRALAALHASERLPAGVPRVLGYQQIDVAGVPHAAARVERVQDHKRVSRQDYLALWLAMDHFADKAPPDAAGMLGHLDAESDRQLAARAAELAVRYCAQLRQGWDWLRRNAMLPEADAHIENVGVSTSGACWLDMGSGEYDDFLKADFRGSPPLLALRDDGQTPARQPLINGLSRAPILLLKGGGPYIGPRGGKWADAAHTAPWKPEAAVEKHISATELAELSREVFKEHVERHGLDIEMYRGARAHDPGTQWFTSSRRSAEGYARTNSGSVRVSRVKMRKPYVASSVEVIHATSATVDRLRAQGYDGIVAQWRIVPIKSNPNPKPEIYAVVFPALLKGGDGAVLRPPAGGGWQVVPRGRRGGYRRRHAGGWEYWYPGAHRSTSAGSTREPAEDASGWTEGDFRAGRYDRDPGKWDYLRGGAEAGWVAGGVDPESAHPVKVAGREHKLYRVVKPEVEVGWALLSNVNEPADEVLVRHERVLPVEYRAAAAPASSAAAAPAAGDEEPPRGGPGARPTGWVAGSAQRLPPFAESTAAEGTVLRRLESGEYPSKLRRRFAEDADGVPRPREDRVVAVPDGDRVRLLEEFAPLVRSAARRALARHGVPQSPEATADAQSAAMEGLLHALEDYRGGSSFALSAQFMASQYAGLQALRELRGGLYLPKRHGRLLPGFLAARAEAYRIYGHEPSAKEVASVWRLHKRDVHEGLARGAELLPMGRYALRAGEVAEGDDRPGKVEWAERYLELLAGQKSPASEKFFAEHELFGSGAGAGLSTEEQLAQSGAVATALEHLRHFEAEVGGQHYRLDAADLLRRHLGFGGQDPESLKEASRHVVVLRQVGQDYRPMSPRGAEAVLPALAERALRAARRHLEGEPAGLVDRAAALAREPAQLAPGPTAFLRLRADAAALSREEVRAWRSAERERLRKLEARHRQAGDHERADGAARARAHLSTVGLNRARRILAEQRLFLAPRNRAWFRSTVPIPIELEHPGEQYGSMALTLTDPSTGEQRRVRVRTVREVGFGKADDYQALPDAAAVLFAASYPRLGALLFGSSDPDAVGAAGGRLAALELAGIIK